MSPPELVHTSVRQASPACSLRNSQKKKKMTQEQKLNFIVKLRISFGDREPVVVLQVCVWGLSRC